jgi:hypothetical protein
MRERRSTKQQLFLFPKLDFLPEQLRVPGVFRQKRNDHGGVFSFDVIGTSILESGESHHAETNRDAESPQAS